MDRSDLGRFRIEQPRLDVVLSEQGSNLGQVFVGRRQKDKPAAAPPDLALGIELIDGSLSFRGLDSPRAWTAEPINFSLALEPSSASPDGRPQLVIEPATVLPHTRVTPEVCQDLLKYIAPILADATQVSGDFSIEVDRWRFPLDDPSRGEGSGRLTIHSLDVGPGPLVAELAKLLKVPPKLLVVEESPVTFRMADGRIYHDDLTFRIERLTIHTRGSVGLDKSLRMTAEVPMPAHLLGEGPVASALAKQTLTIPIAGTLSQPRIDAEAMGESGLKLLSGTLGDLLQGEKKVDLGGLLDAIRDRAADNAIPRNRPPPNPRRASPMPIAPCSKACFATRWATRTPLLDRLRERRKERSK